MKKTLKMFAALVVSIVCLSGCLPTNPMYEQADADRVTAKGSEMMQAWLAENMPDAELTECAAYIPRPLHARGEYLSDYSEGYIRTGEKNTGFLINIVTGAVYFNTDPDTQVKLNEAVEAYIREITGLIADETSDSPVF